MALPLILIALVFLHLVSLHEVGAGNPEGVDIEKFRDEDGVPIDSVHFFLHKVLSALPAMGIFGLVFCAIMFFFPEGGGYFIELANFEEANPLVTPEHIAPVWYYSPLYDAQSSPRSSWWFNCDGYWCCYLFCCAMVR